MTKLVIPITQSDNANPGQVLDVTDVVDDVTLNYGYYKIAAMTVGLLWKKGSADVTVTTGSFLGANDQEVIFIEADNTKLSYIRDPGATENGRINIIFVNITEIPGIVPQNYG